jgi:hypothetical protein
VDGLCFDFPRHATKWVAYPCGFCKGGLEAQWVAYTFRRSPKLGLWMGLCFDFPRYATKWVAYPCGFCKGGLGCRIERV